jgi:hypothetical protein
LIKIARGAEPAGLANIRSRELALLRLLPVVTTDDIPGTYRSVAANLWEQQHYKCCYCERFITTEFNDVEHYRPKGRAVRTPGCTKTHGYWWLTYSWDNLIFSCNVCNRSHKNDKFPLKRGSVSLIAEKLAPGTESPLLIDPASGTNPVEHIEFVQKPIAPGGRTYWLAEPRGGSELGNYTIDVCGLNRGPLRELRNTYFRNHINPHIEVLDRELKGNDLARAKQAFSRALDMMRPRFEFAALTYDAFRGRFDEKILMEKIQLAFPSPARACL